MRASLGVSLRKRLAVAVAALLGATLAAPPAAASPRTPQPSERQAAPAAAAPAEAGPRDFFYDAAGQLVATGNGTEIAVHRYDDAGNLLGTERIAASKTTVFALVPARGPDGAKVEIQGTGFSATASANTVTFDGIDAPVLTATVNRLTVQVPAGTTDGVVRVRVGDATATSPKPFLLGRGAPAPVVTAVSTDRGNKNDVVTITGTGFDPDANRNVVMFHRTVARVQAASATSLTVRIPAAAGSGRITVRTPGGTATSPADFLVAPRGFVMNDLVYAGTIGAARAGVTATIPAGKSALVLLEGKAGERVNLTTDNNTVPVRSALWTFTPFGGNFGRGSLGDPIDLWAGGALSQDLPALPATGLYAMVVKPNGGAAGSMRLTASGTLAGVRLTKDGAGVPFQITVPQQAKEFPFTAAANEWLSLGLTELSEIHNHFVVTITAPDGTSVGWNAAMDQYIPTMVYKAKAAGTYKLSVTFGPNELGFAKVWLSSVINGSTLGVNGAEASLRIERPGQSVRLPFAGTTGQNLQLGYSENLLQQNDRPAYPGALLIEPDEVQRELLTSGYAEAKNLPTLRKTGTHHLLITGWQSVGTVKAWLSTALEGGVLGPNTRRTVTIDRAGRDAFFDFNGTAGRPITMGTIDNAIPGEVMLRLYRPNGNLVSLGSGRTFDVAALPDTGRYRLQVDPETSGTGRINVYAAEPVDLGTVALDRALPANITLPGQKVILKVPGQVGQRLSLGTTSTIPFLTVRVYKPDNTLFTSYNMDTTWGFDLPVMTVAGDYRIELSTPNRDIGDLTLYVNTEHDAGVFTIDGPTRTIPFARPAQNARLTFAGTSGARLDLMMDRLALTSGTAFYYTLIGPDGRTLANHWYPTRMRDILPTLTATGTHTLVLDPPQGATGEVDVRIMNRTTPLAGAGRAAHKPKPPAQPGSAVCDTDPEVRYAPTSPAPGEGAQPAPEPAPANACQLNAGWKPDARNLSGAEWTTGEQTAPARDRALQFPVGVTGVVGKVLNTVGKPLAEVTVSAAGKKTTTDARGRFALADVPGGHLSLRVDGRTASVPGSEYGLFDIGVEVERGQVMVLPYTVFLPELDTANTVGVRSPTTEEVVLTTKAIPGLEVHIPKGTVIRDADGKVATELNLTPIPIDRPPFPLPPTKVPVYFTVQPGGGVLFPQGATIIYPNYTREAPGSRTQFWNYDPDGKGWHLYGMGRVSRDGKQIVPDANVRFYRLTGAMTAVPGMNPPLRAPVANGTRVADPVDPATGLLVDDAVDLTVEDLMPIQVKRTYQQGDTDVRAFGVGMNFDYGIFPWSPGVIGNFDFQQFDLVQPDGSKIHYHRTSPGKDYAGAIFAADPTPTQYDGSTVAWNGDGWDVTLRDGTVIVLGDEAPIQAIRDKFGNTTTITRATAGPGTDGKVRLNGAITQITSPSGRWVKFAYDSGNPPRISSVEDNIGRKVSYEYDATGHLRKVTNPDLGVTEYGWDAAGRLKTIKDPRATEYLLNEYDDAGRVKSQKAADGGMTTFDYVAANGVITETRMTDGRGHVRRFTFNDKGSVLTDTKAFGTAKAQTTTTEYDASGVRVKATVDALNRRAAYEYDAQGRVKQLTYLDGTPQAQTERWEYNGPHGELTKYTDTYGKSTVYELDARGAIKSVTDPMNRRTGVVVDANGLTTQVTDPALKTTVTDYVGADPVQVRDAAGRISRTGFDPIGRPISTVDARGAVTDTAWNTNGKVRSVVDPLGRTTSYAYNANGFLRELTDARQGKTVYDYNPMDLVEKITDPLGRAETFEYDANGNLKKHTSRRDVVTEHDYDELDRRSATRIGGTTTIGYTFDLGGRLRSTTDSVAGVTTREYDDFDRVKSETTPQGTVSYAYGATVRDRTMTLPGRTPTRHVSDASGVLAEIQQNGAQVTVVTPDAVGRPRQIGAPGNGVHQAYTYTDAGEIKTITYRNGATQLGDLSYEYDLAGLPIRTTGAFSRTDLPAAFGPATYDAANRIATIDGARVDYDADGNLTSDGRTTYTWNDRGQLAGLSRTGFSASFGYSADGRRTGRTIDGTTTDYLYDGDNPVQEKVGGAVTATMTSGGIDAWQLRESGGATRRFLTDAVGSTVALVDGAGAVASYTYGPFGTTTLTGNDGGNPYRYTGREDDGTGLQYNRARYYSPVLQRFISEDPLGAYSGDASPYTYAQNQPTARTDPDGLKPCLGNSFTPETKVAMADGSHKRIADVEPGDKVLAGDSATGLTAGKRVDATIEGDGVKRLVKVAVDSDGDGKSDGSVTATRGHPFWVVTPGEWRDAKDLRAGDLLRTGAGTYAQVTAVDKRTATQRVHNLSVEGLHTYYVAAGDADVLVHNCATHGSTCNCINGALRGPGGLFAPNPATPVKPPSSGVHGNSLNSTAPTVLYQLTDKVSGAHLKWGITSNPNPFARYTKAEMAGKDMTIIANGTRADMAAHERFLTERWPGPLNHEKWAGSKPAFSPGPFDGRSP
ncbi:RHS repeat-associated core domain-containing protein [Actinoplanes sp. NPDC051346]|uniref:RHS repeat-associated core domain-containing protein n=1 Tax=Actinoplanes sp. NPDC051346 TaxID=3155048 RepID=UPI003432A791